MLPVLASSAEQREGKDCASNTRGLKNREEKMLAWEAEGQVLGWQEGETVRSGDCLKGKKGKGGRENRTRKGGRSLFISSKQE